MSDDRLALLGRPSHRHELRVRGGVGDDVVAEKVRRAAQSIDPHTWDALFEAQYLLLDCETIKPLERYL